MRFANKTRAVLAVLVAGFVAASCTGDKNVTAPPSARPAMANSLGESLGGVTDGLSRLTGTLMTCRPLPYASDSKVIGPAGGELNVGPHKFVVPPGALSHNVRISAEAPSDSVNSIRFSPEGLEFERSTALTMSYANCGIVVGLLPRIAYTTESLHILEIIPSLPDLLNRKVTGRVDHFSRYAVSW